MALFPVFLSMIIIHGLGFWFTLFTPLAVIFVTPGLIILMIQQIGRLTSGYTSKFEIIDVSISANCAYIMIYFKKPPKYKLVHGQFIYLNVPKIHPLQWHPFTVASSPNCPNLVLMIKVAGDWTRKLALELFECK